MKLTIGRMAKLYGLHRSTLHEAVSKGRVSAGLDGKGQRVVDLSEMIRVYGEPPGRPDTRPTPEPDTAPTLPTDTLQALMSEIQSLREEVRELRETMLLIEHKPTVKQATPDTKYGDKPAEKVRSFADIVARFNSER